MTERHSDTARLPEKVTVIWLILVGIVVGCGAAAAADDGDLTVGEKFIHEKLGDRVRTVRLWPGEPPDEVGDIGEEKLNLPEKEGGVVRLANVTRPSLTVCRPKGAEGDTPAVLVCPGGGYHILALDLEGTEIVQWLNSLGVTGVLLKYRVPRRQHDFPKHHHAVQDGQRAMGLIRENAEEWGIDPDRVGILGFSAGGNLSITVCNNYSERLYEPVDAADEESCKPDFAVPIYPAYLTEKNGQTFGQIQDLQHPDKMSPESTPPTFIAISQMDRFMPGGLSYFRTLTEADVPAELHVYEGGSHGGGTRAYPFRTWTKECARWMDDHGLAGDDGEWAE